MPSILNNKAFGEASALAMMSQNDRAAKRGRDYQNNILRKVSIDDKEGLFASIKKGKNDNGGNWGGIER